MSETVDEIRGAAILRGVRGLPAADQQALAALIVNVSQLAADFPEISEIDLNPVMASANGAIAVDARFVVEQAAHPQPPRPQAWEMRAAMRRILIDHARKRASAKGGGGGTRVAPEMDSTASDEIAGAGAPPADDDIPF